MKKFATVDTFRPSCSAIVFWTSLFGRFVSLKIATSVRRWMSVKTRRGFFTGKIGSCLIGISGSLRLQTGKK